MTNDELLAEFPNLVTSDQSKLSRPALGTKNLRTILRKRWPHVKFSVTSDKFAGGSSIDIRWDEPLLNPPLEADVAEYAECFKYSKVTDPYSDGMGIDSEKFAFAQKFGGAKYVHITCKNLTDEKRAQLTEAHLDEQLPTAQSSRRPRM